LFTLAAEYSIPGFSSLGNSEKADLRAQSATFSFSGSFSFGCWVKSMEENEVHGVGPEQRAGDGAPLFDPGLKHTGIIEGLRDLLGEVAFLVGLSLYPGQ
jgi:hypothetical protein